MKAIKVNADYESVLFNNKKELPLINEAIEFLAFYLVEQPILTRKNYAPDFLSHVESLTGKKVRIIKEGLSENWWGELRDLELERKLNSKEMSAELSVRENWCKDTKILSSLGDLPDISDGKIYLAKNPYGMSGQNFSLVSESNLGNISSLLKNGKVILEPFLDRVYDFSHFFYPNGEMICYQNLIDHRFQYRGTLFQNFTEPYLTQLKFYSEVDSSKWIAFSNALKKIQQYFFHSDLAMGFSVDSFIYREDEVLKIRYLSEVNYRRTMGQVAYELSRKLAQNYSWTMFVLCKSSGLGFSHLKELISPLKDVIILSPGNVRYDMFLIRANNNDEGRELFNALKKLLPSAEFTIEL